MSCLDLTHFHHNAVIEWNLLENVFRIGNGGENIVQCACGDTLFLDKINHFGKAYSRNADVVAIGNGRVKEG